MKSPPGRSEGEGDTVSISSLIHVSTSREMWFLPFCNILCLGQRSENRMWKQSEKCLSTSFAVRVRVYWPGERKKKVTMTEFCWTSSALHCTRQEQNKCHSLFTCPIFFFYRFWFKSSFHGDKYLITIHISQITPTVWLAGFVEELLLIYTEIKSNV